jgi:hypothetical protein
MRSSCSTGATILIGPVPCGGWGRLDVIIDPLWGLITHGAEGEIRVHAVTYPLCQAARAYREQAHSTHRKIVIQVI